MIYWAIRKRKLDTCSAGRLRSAVAVEAYRAERVQASELEETLGISLTELRRLNRNYFRYRLLPLLHPKQRRKAMKRDADYVKTLEKKLAETDRGAGA